MTSDVENLTRFYANLPSIFGTESTLEAIKSSANSTRTSVDNEQAYQSIFGSFLFADSEPLTRAAFVASTSSSREMKSTDEEQTDEASTSKANPIPIEEPSSLALVEDISDIDDDDDFDGIPIRQTSSIGMELHNHDNHLLDQLVLNDEIDDDNDDDEEKLFLNGFIDEQQPPDRTIIPSLFNNIPDIDDLNEHDEENDDDQVPFDPMDMLDDSDSIRSSSPDSVLSSSHLRDDDDYDIEDDVDMNHHHDNEDDVTQWNDDDILGRITSQNNRPNAPIPPPMVLNIHSDDQVNFIDSSRSNSRCSNASSHLSIGYTDQARIFINDDDGLVSSSDSEDDRIHFDDDGIVRENSDEEPSLQVNLDYPHSRSRSSSSSQSDHSRCSTPPPIPDQTPILPIDDHIDESRRELQSAPIAHVDDEDDDLAIFPSNRPVLSPIPSKTLLELRNDYRQNELVHDIINMRHILNEHDNDDEFIAIMHNPTVFEEVLYDHDDEQQQKSASIKPTNHLPTSFQTSSLFSIESESFEHCQNTEQTPSLLSVSINEKNSPSNLRTTNHSCSTAVNHLPIGEGEEKKKKENVDVVNRSCSRKLKITQQSTDENTTNINIKQITNGEEKRQDHYQMMSSDDDQSDNDSELLKTLAQLHGLVHSPALSTDPYRSSHLPSKVDENSNFNFHEKPNLISSNDVDKNHREIEEPTSSTFFSSASLTSSALSNDDESHSTDIMIDSNASSSLIMSSHSEHKNSFDQEIQSIVDKLVADTLQQALDQLNQTSEPIDQFVERILSDAIYQIYTEDHPPSIGNLVPVLDWHHHKDKQIIDPFDQHFHTQWLSPLQTPDDQINATAFHSNAFDELNLFTLESNQANFIHKEIVSSALPIDLESPLTTIANQSRFQYKTESPVANDENIEPFVDQESNVTTSEVELRTSIDENPAQPIKRESFFENQLRLSQFDSFASDHPLNVPGLESIASGIDRQLNESPQIPKPIDVDNEPWELEDHREENLKPIPTSVTQNEDLYNKYLPENTISTPDLSVPLTEITINEESETEEENNEVDKENYDDYFSKYKTTENPQSVESPTVKSVRFSDKLPNVAILTPKQSINLSESSTSTSDSDETEEDIEDTNDDQTNVIETNGHPLPDVIMRNTITPRPDSNVSLTESDELPPPLPPLPPLDNKPLTSIDNIPSTSLNRSLKSKIISRTQPNPTVTNQTPAYMKLQTNSTDSQLVQPNEAAILRSISKENSNTDPDEVNDIISCVIDNNPIDIDVKTISPFKCVIGSAGQLDRENQTTIIALYGCWLPDHRLREYRYIMDQLFYYVYHKLEKLVSNEYVLVYFHGATPKHRTPDLKFLRKCYQMINFRLRKNLQAVYVVHPTRWLRTIIALSRPFFSNKFYHKVHYLFTIAELERQFPHNHITIPVIIEQTDWLYSQKYDRHNASIKRSIERSASRLVSGIEDESAA